MSCRLVHQAILGLLLLAAFGAPNRARADESFRPFKLKTLEGAQRSLSDVLGKATVVVFFFPTCKYCNAAFPEIQKIYDGYKDRGLSMVWINILPEQEELVAGWAIKRHLTVPVLVGASQDSLEKDYLVTATPTNILLGEKGEVLFRQAGYKKGDEITLESRIAQALNTATASNPVSH